MIRVTPEDFCTFLNIFMTSCHLNNKGDDDMPREGEEERVFNDPTATAGSVMGIQKKKSGIRAGEKYNQLHSKTGSRNGTIRKINERS